MREYNKLIECCVYRHSYHVYRLSLVWLMRLSLVPLILPFGAFFFSFSIFSLARSLSVCHFLLHSVSLFSNGWMGVRWCSFFSFLSTSLYFCSLFFSSSLCNNQKNTIGGVLNSKTNTTAVVTLTMNQDKNVRTHARTIRPIVLLLFYTTIFCCSGRFSTLTHSFAHTHSTKSTATTKAQR